MRLPETALKFFADFVFNELGILYRDENYYQLDSRIQEIAKLLAFESSEDFYNKAKVNLTQPMRAALLDFATNNETSFFRDTAIFTALSDSILPSFSSRLNAPTALRVWSAACSFGQEVYSVAMTLEQNLQKVPGGRYQILATDVNARVLKAAERGVYDELQVSRGLDLKRRELFFAMEKNGDKEFWKVKPQLSKNISFVQQNLMQPFSTLGTFDLILCRNVLIYQTPARKKDVVERMWQSLSKDGILILGSAESLIGITEKFETLRGSGATYFKKIA